MKQITYRELINERIGRKNYDILQFWNDCPFDFDQIINKSRKQELMLHRQCAMTYYVMSGRSLSEVGAKFGKDHATVISSMKNVYEALNVKNDKLANLWNAYIFKLTDYIEPEPRRLTPERMSDFLDSFDVATVDRKRIESILEKYL